MDFEMLNHSFNEPAGGALPFLYTATKDVFLKTFFF